MSVTNGVTVADVKSSAAAAEDSRSEILKVRVIETRGGANAFEPTSALETQWKNTNTIEPPYPPDALNTLLEHSGALRQNVDAMVANIDSFGYRFEPVLDLEADDADEEIASLLLLEAAEAAAESVDRMGGDVAAIVADPQRQLPEPTPEQVEQRKKELREQMRFEKRHVAQFFESCCLEYSFVTLRRRTRQDIEVEGNGYWEVTRSEDGEIAQFDHVPAFTMRMRALDREPTQIVARVPTADFDWQDIHTRKRFRRFVQVFEGRTVVFKEFGDPRLISRKDGRVFATPFDAAVAEKEDPADGLATEILHFKVHSSKTPYGVPRWIGNLLSVLGSRQAEEVNYMYFENKSVPPLAVLVSGGRISESSVQRIKEFIENDIKGKKNFHKLLVLEAEGQELGSNPLGGGKMRIDLKPLTAAQHNDALFQNYDERNIDKVGQSFRLPRMLRGDIRDFNRATAEAAVEFAEAQVFGPERDEFDFTINRRILPLLGIRFWKFKSNSPATRNPVDLSDMISKLVNANVMTPQEAREEAGNVFNREFKKVSAPWVRQPVQLTLAGIAPPEELTAPGQADPTVPDPNAAQLVPAAPSEQAAPTGSAQLTGTDVATIVTVNEARKQVGLPDLTRTVNGQKERDPDGDLTVAEFKAKRAAAGQALGTAIGDAAAAGGQVTQRFDPQKLIEQALHMRALSKAVDAIEVAEAREEFLEAKRAEGDAEDGAPVG